MMGRLVKHYGNFDKEDFVSAIMPEELLNAPGLDGKSFMDRYDELLTCDSVEYIAD